jgi:hypothetical protein
MSRLEFQYIRAIVKMSVDPAAAAATASTKLPFNRNSSIMGTLNKIFAAGRSGQQKEDLS